MVAYGEEGLKYTSNSITASSNTFESSGLANAIGIYDPSSTPVQLSSNTFTGIATPVYPSSAVVTSGTAGTGTLFGFNEISAVSAFSGPGTTASGELTPTALSRDGGNALVALSGAPMLTAFGGNSPYG